MRIVLVTDAWHPQVNGVVRTWTTMLRILAEWGHEVTVVSPEGSRTIPAPSEPDLRLCLQPGRQLRRVLGDRVPDALHIATEGPLGLAARKMALARGWRFTTSFHTMFPDYLQARMGIPAALPWRYLRWFHRPAARAGAHAHGARHPGPARPGQPADLVARVDPVKFQPGASQVFRICPVRCSSAWAGSRGKRTWTPSCRWTCRAARWWWAAADEARLKKKFPDAVFLGMRNDDELPGYYQAADVFVFPSLTDTFGLVMLEAMACGTPVAAFRSEAPLAVVQPGVTGCLDEDLAHACREALSLDRHAVRAHALTRSWDAIASDLLAALAPLTPRAEPDPPLVHAG